MESHAYEHTRPDNAVVYIYLLSLPFHAKNKNYFSKQQTFDTSHATTKKFLEVSLLFGLFVSSASNAFT